MKQREKQPDKTHLTVQDGATSECGKRKQGHIANVTLRGRFYHAEIMVDGKRRRYSTKCTNKADAMRSAQAEKRRMLDAAAARREEGDEDTNFDDAANEYWKANRLLLRDSGERSSKAETRRVLRRTVRAVDPATMCSSMDMGFFIDLRTKLMEEPPPPPGKRGRRRKRAQGLMPKTVNNILEMGLRVLNFAETKLGMKFPNKPLPSATDSLFLPVEGRGIYLKDSDEEMLKRSCEQDLKDAIEFDLETGLRASELVGVRWDQIDVIEESMTVPVKAKGLDARLHTVFLTPKALEILDRRRGLHDEYVFTVRAPTARWRDGVFIEAGTHIRMTYVMLERRFAHAVTSSGLSDLVLHDLRRTAARRIWWDEGLEVAQAFLGHRDRSTTLEYLALEEADLKAATRHRAKQQERRRAEIAMAVAAGRKIPDFDDKRIARIRAELGRRERTAKVRRAA